MALLGTLQVRMGLDTASFGTKFNNFTKDLQKRANGFSKGLSGLTDFGALLGGAGIGAALTQGIRIAADYEKTMNQVAAAANVGEEAIKGLSDIVAEATKGSIFSMNQGAEGLLALQKAGQSLTDSKSSLAESLKLAAAEGMGFEWSANLMVKTLSQFNLTAKESPRVADALAGAAAGSTASLEDLRQALKAVGTNAATMGLDVNQTLGAFSLFSQKALEGSDAGTSFKTFLGRLVPATDKAAAAMAAYGLKFTDAKGNFLEIEDIFDQLHDKLGRLSESELAGTLQEIFGTDAIRAANIAVREGGTELRKYIALTKDSNAAEKLAEASTKGFAGAMLKLKNNIQSLFIEKSGQTGFLKFLEELATKGSALVDKIKLLPPEFFEVAIGVAAGAAILPPFALAISSIVTAVPALLTGLGALTGFLLGPWGLAIAAAVATGILFKDELIAAWAGLKEWFAGWVQENQPLLDQLKSAWDGFLASFGPLFASAKQAISNFAAEIAKAFGTNTSGLFTSFKDIAGAALQWIVQGATTAINGLTTFVNWISANLPAAGTFVGQVAATIINGFRSMSAGVAAAWQWIKNAFATARDFLVAGFAELVARLEPLRAAFQTWSQVCSEIWATVKSAGALAFEALKLGFGAVLTALRPCWDALKEFGAYIANTFGPPIVAAFNMVKETGIAVWNGIKEAMSGFWEYCKGAVSGIIAEFDKLGQRAVAPIRNLRAAIDTVSAGLKVMTRTGEEAEDKAVGNSWLTDLCEKGVQWFTHLVRGGIMPAKAALEDFSKTGAGALAGASGPGFFGGAALQERFAGMAKSIKEGAIQVQSVWTSAMNHVGSAIDEFVKTGKLNFSDLVRSIIADLASAALKNAFNGLLQGILGMTGSSGGALGAGSGGGLLSGLGSIFSGLFGGLATFEGGGFTGNGSRTGGMDGRGGRLAILHPRETVVDHAAVKRSAGNSTRRPQVNVPVTINLQPGVSKEELAGILPLLKRDIIATIPALIGRGGRYAGAFGQ